MPPLESATGGTNIKVPPVKLHSEVVAKSSIPSSVAYRGGGKEAMTCPFGLRHRSGPKGTTGVSEEEQLLTLAVLVVWIFHRVLGGGGVFTPPPSNSAPELRSDMRQAAFESSSKISKKVHRSFLSSGQRSGHQRSSKSKCSRFSTISIILNFRRSSS